MRVYSCYFSPNDPFEDFETQILLLEESLSKAVGRCLIDSDFNSKSPEKDRTARRGAKGSIIDFTIAVSRLASKTGASWR